MYLLFHIITNNHWTHTTVVKPTTDRYPILHVNFNRVDQRTADSLVTHRNYSYYNGAADERRNATGRW